MESPTPIDEYEQGQTKVRNSWIEELVELFTARPMLDS
jgi:hypothetical protein